MSNFQCIPCKYQTKDRSNYAKHLKSNKHQKSISTTTSTFASNRCQINSTFNDTKLPYQCEYCRLTFTRQSGLTYHKKICMETKFETLEIEKNKQKLEAEKKMEIQQKDSENQIVIEKLKTELEMSKKQITDQGNKINNLENFIKTIKTTPTYNISIKKLVQTSYSNAPPLAQLENYEVIHDQQFVDFVDEVINYNDQKILYKYIGDIIIKHYKKDKPEDQSLWNTDVSRLNYIIKEAMANNKSKWIDDINASRLKESIIQPLLEYIKAQIVKEQKLIHKKIKQATSDQCIDLTMKVNSLAQIQYEINNGTLENDIVRYISPSFRPLIDNQKIE